MECPGTVLLTLTPEDSHRSTRKKQKNSINTFKQKKKNIALKRHNTAQKLIDSLPVSIIAEFKRKVTVKGAGVVEEWDHQCVLAASAAAV